MLTAQEAQAATGIAVSNAEVKCYKVTGVNQCTVSLRPPSAPTFPAFVNIASFPTTAEAEQAVRSVAKTDSGDVKYTVLRRSPSAVTFVTTMPYGESVNVIRQVGNRLIHGSCDKPKDEPNAKARACATALAAAQVTKAK